MMKYLTHKMAQFFRGEDFAEHGEDARLELTPAELRQISYLMTENVRLKTKLNKYNKAFDSIKDTLGIEALPPAQPEQKFGKWIVMDDDRISGRCSVCGWEAHMYEDDVVGMDYCPNCGSFNGGE